MLTSKTGYEEANIKLEVQLFNNWKSFVTFGV